MKPKRIPKKKIVRFFEAVDSRLGYLIAAGAATRLEAKGEYIVKTRSYGDLWIGLDFLNIDEGQPEYLCTIFGRFKGPGFEKFDECNRCSGKWNCHWDYDGLDADPDDLAEQFMSRLDKARFGGERSS